MKKCYAICCSKDHHWSQLTGHLCVRPFNCILQMPFPRYPRYLYYWYRSLDHHWHRATTRRACLFSRLWPWPRGQYRTNSDWIYIHIYIYKYIYICQITYIYPNYNGLAKAIHGRSSLANYACVQGVVSYKFLINLWFIKSVTLVDIGRPLLTWDHDQTNVSVKPSVTVAIWTVIILTPI